MTRPENPRRPLEPITTVDTLVHALQNYTPDIFRNTTLELIDNRPAVDLPPKKDLRFPLRFLLELSTGSVVK